VTRRLPPALAGVLLLFGGVVVGLLLSELAYRVARRFVCVGGSPGVPAVARPFGWTHRPGGVGEAYACFGRRYEWRAPVAINAHGLRERAIDYPKPTGVRRVLLLGDSMTEAIQVPAERTFARLVEAQLGDSGAPVEVINAGHAGFATDNELLFYRDEGRRYDSDLVVQVFNIQNDVYENFAPLYRRAYERAAVQWPPKPSFTVEDGVLREHPAPPAPPPIARGGALAAISSWLASQLFVVRSVDRMLHAPAPAAGSAGPPLNYDLYAPTEDASWRDAWTVTTALTQELRRTVERDGHRFAVVVLPPKEAIEGPASFAMKLRMFGVDARGYDLDRPRRRIVDFLHPAGIRFLDLSPVLQADAAAGGQPFFTWDVHFTAHGHAAIAPAIARFVKNVLGV
jgi:hypothetical protein